MFEISGKQYNFQKGNLLNIRELIIDFDQEKDIVMKAIDFHGGQLEMKLPSDGSYVKDTTRTSKNDTVFIKGYWQDDKTFVIAYEASDRQLIYVTFDNDKVILKSVNRGQVLFDNMIGLHE